MAGILFMRMRLAAMFRIIKLGHAELFGCFVCSDCRSVQSRLVQFILINLRRLSVCLSVLGLFM